MTRPWVALEPHGSTGYEYPVLSDSERLRAYLHVVTQRTYLLVGRVRSSPSTEPETPPVCYSDGHVGTGNHARGSNVPELHFLLRELIVTLCSSPSSPRSPSPMSSSHNSQPEASTSTSATDYLQNAQFQRPGGASSPETITSTDLLLAAYDPTKLHPLAELGDKLDYLVLDDEKVNEVPGSGTAVPSRGWSDDLCYGTGTMYLGGKFRISFKLLFRARALCLGPSCSLNISHLISFLNGPFGGFIVLVVTCSHCVSRFDAWRVVGCSGRRSKAACRV